MRNIELTIGESTYKLATNLRVAYVLQGMHNHKPYLEIFQGVDKLPLEGQIGFLYAAYKVACTGDVMSRDEFLNLCLDNLDLSIIMDTIKQIIEGVTGKKLLEEATSVSEEDSNAESKN